jgi:protein SCO1/2
VNLSLASSVVTRVRRLLPAAIAAAGSLLLVACGSSGAQSSGSDSPVVIDSPASQGFTGATFQPSKLLPDVTLTDTAGNPWNFLHNGAGKVTVLYFGYTNCPDACPTDMAAMGTAIRSLTPAEQQKVQMVFVTVDPRRDKPAVIRKWLDRFDTRLAPFVGLTGTNAELTTAAHKLGLQFEVTSQPDGLEKVEHSSQLTAFDATGTANLAWLDPPVPHDIAHDLRLLVSGVTPV